MSDALANRAAPAPGCGWSPSKIEKEHSTNPFDVGVELSMGEITLEAATLFLEDNTFSAGALQATGSANLARIELDADFFGSILLGLPPVFGATAGLSVAGFDIASFSYDIIDVDIGPQFSVRQDFEFTPELWVAMQFDQPVVIGGVTTTQHSMPVGTTLDVVFDDADSGGTLDVQTSYSLKNQFRNTTNLQVAPFVDAVALAASFDTFLGTVFDDALFDFAPIVGPAATVATIFDQTYQLGGFGNVPGQTLSLVFNQPPVINPEDLVPSAATVNEGSPLTLAGTFADADAGQTHTVVIDWGDGTNPTMLDLGAGVHAFNAEHTYADDSAVPRTIVATVTDPFDAGDNAAIQVSVVNVAPTLALTGADAVDEGALYTLNPASSDPGADTITSWRINWGDGHIEDVAGNPSSVTHTYADGTRAYTIEATATDEDGTFAAPALVVSVDNIEPTASLTGSSLNVDADGNPVPFSGVRGQTLYFTGAFTDPGFDNPAAPTVETFNYIIEWGDGTSTGELAATVDSAGSPGVPTMGSFAGSHIYGEAGSYLMTVRVNDDDGGEAVLTQTVTIAATSMQVGGDLAVGGTAGSDVMLFLALKSWEPRVITVQCGGIDTYHDVNRILAFGQGSNDLIAVVGSLAVPAVFYGDDGHDILLGGKGNDVLDGGAGDDLILGGHGRDLLVGGTGADRLIGNSADDILIAGSLAFTNQEAATAAIMAEWTSDHDYATRLANLSGRTEAQGNTGFGDRLNAGYFLTAGSTVLDDEDQDKVTGSGGDDWFFFDPDLDRATDLRDEAFAGDLDSILGTAL
ncbi:MAG: PKD domain-containing protein [Gemmataceae bacterium]|nr:PKD domain-containing protein [Gemmataceae bacterium]